MGQGRTVGWRRRGQGRTNLGFISKEGTTRENGIYSSVHHSIAEFVVAHHACC